MTREAIYKFESTFIPPGGTGTSDAKALAKGEFRGLSFAAPLEPVTILAGGKSFERPQGMSVGDWLETVKFSLTPPNAYVIVVLSNPSGEGVTTEGTMTFETDESVATPAIPPPPQPQGGCDALPTAKGKVISEIKTDERGWPVGGSNEVWVLLSRGEAERLLRAVNGDGIHPGERPALVRRFRQAMGL